MQTDSIASVILPRAVHVVTVAVAAGGMLFFSHTLAARMHRVPKLVFYLLCVYVLLFWAHVSGRLTLCVP